MLTYTPLIIDSLGELGNFPDTWDPMDKNDDVLEVPLDTTKQEFADVLNAFMSTIGNAQMQQVIEVLELIILLYRPVVPKLIMCFRLLRKWD